MAGHEESSSMTLAEFISIFPLPRRAQVTEGFQDPYNDDNEWSKDDIIQVNRVVCPFVRLSFRNPLNGEDICLSVSTKNRTQFQVVCPMTPVRSFVEVSELVRDWPLLVKVRKDWSPNTACEKYGGFKCGDRLRLIRQVPSDDGKKLLECSVVDQMRLVQLPMNCQGMFLEISTNRTYTLCELVQMAAVERRLKIVRNVNFPTCIRGVPADFDNTLRFELPQILVELELISELEEMDRVTETGEKLEDIKFLVPADSDIRVMSSGGDAVDRRRTHTLAQIGLFTADIYPFLTQIGDWSNEPTILYNHHTRPGDQLVIYGVEKSVSKILARCVDHSRYFVIPVNHQGHFVQVLLDGYVKAVHLSDMLKATLPQDVRLRLDKNLTDDPLLDDQAITLEAIIESEDTVLVSKRCIAVIGDSFHLPLRTPMKVVFKQHLKAPPKPKLSARDMFAEEISESEYSILIETKGGLKY